MRSIVVDTGPLIAWCDPDDKHHRRGKDWLMRRGGGFSAFRLAGGKRPLFELQSHG